MDRVATLVRELYAVVRELEEEFPGRPFTPDGHLVGSIGEVIAAHRYGLTLAPASSKLHDATAADGRSVEIKITQAKSVAFRGEPHHLIVLKLAPDGDTSEIYNGPGAPVWTACGGTGKNGQRSIGLAKLKTLNAQVPASHRLPNLQECVQEPSSDS